MGNVSRWSKEEQQCISIRFLQPGSFRSGFTSKWTYNLFFRSRRLRTLREKVRRWFSTLDWPLLYRLLTTPWLQVIQGSRVWQQLSCCSWHSPWLSLPGDSPHITRPKRLTDPIISSVSRTKLSCRSFKFSGSQDLNKLARLSTDVKPRIDSF